MGITESLFHQRRDGLVTSYPECSNVKTFKKPVDNVSSEKLPWRYNDYAGQSLSPGVNPYLC